MFDNFTRGSSGIVISERRGKKNEKTTERCVIGWVFIFNVSVSSSNFVGIRKNHGISRHVQPNFFSKSYLGSDGSVRQQHTETLSFSTVFLPFFYLILYFSRFISPGSPASRGQKYKCRTLSALTFSKREFVVFEYRFVEVTSHTESNNPAPRRQDSYCVPRRQLRLCRSKELIGGPRRSPDKGYAPVWYGDGITCGSV